MALVDETSPVVAVPSLNIFTKAPVQNSYIWTRTFRVRPVEPLNSGGVYTFNIKTPPNIYTKLYKTTLYSQLQVVLTKKDASLAGSADWANIAPVNNFHNSLWSQVDCSIGDQQITRSIQTYPFRSYFE